MDVTIGKTITHSTSLDSGSTKPELKPDGLLIVGPSPTLPHDSHTVSAGASDTGSGPKLDTAPEVSFAPRPLLRLSVDVMKNEENLTCADNEDLFTIGSHYSKVPIPINPTFYKCADRASKYTKIDFDKLKTNVKCTNIIYGGIQVRILGINDLYDLYSRSKREQDKIKLVLLKYFVNKILKIDGKNEYIGT
jgi:hypothetical protein